MNCPKCDATITWNMQRCSFCGHKITVYKKLIATSNAFYNRGLEQAKVRNLSGSIESLKRSLKLYRYNTNARNLLGLVYLEMGETVLALSEWVISNHLQPKDNDAAEYIERIQANPVQLDQINLTIKKYNSALQSAKTGGSDLAIIQLKKVISLNPKFVRAYQLLALLYMKTEEEAKSVKCLKRARRIDTNNTLTEKYLSELEANYQSETAGTMEKPPTNRGRKTFRGEEVKNIMPVNNYKEEKPKVLPFINVIIGIVIGLAVGYILIRPTLKDATVKDNNSSVVTHSEQLAEKESQISSLENEVKNLKVKLEGYEQAEAAAAEENKNGATLAESYEALLASAQLYMDNKMEDAAEELLKADETKLTSDSAQELYTKIKDASFEKASKKVGEEGRVAYNSNKFDEAKPLLEKAISLNPQNVDAIYFMGRLYHKKNKKDKAQEYYSKVLTDFPTSARVTEAKNRLRELGVSAEDINNITPNPSVSPDVSPSASPAGETE